MPTLKYLLLSSIAFLFIFQKLEGKKPEEGYIVLENNDTIWGFISYRLIDVPNRILFISQEGLLKTKTIYAPNELLVFVYGKEETWRSIAFSKLELGWQASYFMQVKLEKGPIELLRGKISSETCQCSGAGSKATYEWLLYNTQTEEKLLVETNRFGFIKKPIWVASFFSSCGYDFNPEDLKTMRNLKKHLTSLIL